MPPVKAHTCVVDNVMVLHREHLRFATFWLQTNFCEAAHPESNSRIKPHFAGWFESERVVS